MTHYQAPLLWKNPLPPVESVHQFYQPQEAQAVRQLNNDKFTIFKSLIVYYLCVLFAALLHGCVASH